MCAILGIASKNNIVDSTWITTGLKSMNHRGPDMKGQWISDDNKVVLGHNRLSIIDLSVSGKQPMSYQGNYHVTLNGEIYNFNILKNKLLKNGFQFKSDTDTEVLLAAYAKWGIKFLNHLEGMFAFALYDKSINKIFLVRDRAGEKPLYYYYNDNNLVFSSEIKGMLANKDIPAELDYSSLSKFLSLGYTSNSSSILNKIKKVKPGHYICFDINTGNFIMNKYWELPKWEPDGRNINSIDLIDEFEKIFNKSVSSQLVSDVPLGILLSGGLDSSLITATAAKSVRKIKTFTIKFSNSKKYDESKHADLISKYFGTEHYELEASSIKSDIFYKLSEQYDEPLIDSSMIPTSMICELVKKHCTVALGGDGGDELFGGYNYYRRSALFYHYFKWMSIHFRAPISKLASLFFSKDTRGYNWIDYFGKNFKNDLPILLNKFDNIEKTRLFKNEIEKNWIEYNYSLDDTKLNEDLQSLLTVMDFENFLPDDILVKTDRASMMHSLEVRAPFLDKDLIEFAFRKIPSSSKFTHKKTKQFLKVFSKKILPPNFDFSRKQGFEFPLGDLLKTGEIRSFFKEVLLDESCVFKPETINKYFESLDNGRRVEEKLFGLLQFQLWKSKYSIVI